MLSNVEQEDKLLQYLPVWHVFLPGSSLCNTVEATK